VAGEATDGVEMADAAAKFDAAQCGGRGQQRLARLGTRAAEDREVSGIGGCGHIDLRREIVAIDASVIAGRMAVMV